MGNSDTLDEGPTGDERPVGAVSGTSVSISEPANVRLGRGKLTLRRFLRNKLAVIGLIGILLLIIIATLGPYLLPWGYLDIDKKAFLKPPSAKHWLGTTQAGRDVLALTIAGMRKSLIIGFLAGTIATGLASVVGTAAAYFGGWTQRIALWVIDLLLIVPSTLIIAVMMKGGVNHDYAWVVLALLLGAFGWMITGRVMRSMTLSIRNREYVLAAKYMGLPPWKIITRHIIPNISSYMIVDLTLGVGGYILAETGLSFLGLGIQAPDTSLGTLIGEGARMATTYSWIFLTPSAILVFLVLCINAVGDGLRDALDPSSQSGGSAA